MSQGVKQLLALLATAPLLLVGLNGCSADEPPTPTQPTVQPLPTGQKAVILTASPVSIPADGQSSTALVAVCTVGGQKAPNNLPVWFKTDRGDLSLNGVDPINQSQVTRSYQVLTADGQTSIFLLSETEPGVARVTAIFGSDASDSASVNFVRSGSDVGSIELAITPESGPSPLTVQATATVKSRDNVNLSGVRVNFDINDTSARIDNKRIKSDSSGTASTFIRNIKNDATITAGAGGIKAKQLVEIDNEEDKSLTLAAIKSDGSSYDEPVLVNSNAQLLLRATVKSERSGGTPVSDVPVNFSINDAGAYFSKNQVTTNSNGEAETFVHNINIDSTIMASTKNTSDSLVVKINNRPVARIRHLSGQPDAGEVNVFVFSAEDSYDPDEAFGDKITISWTFTIEATTNVPVSPASSTSEVVTVTVGSVSVPPSVGDKLVAVLTVTDSSGLTDSTIFKLSFQ